MPSKPPLPNSKLKRPPKPEPKPQPQRNPLSPRDSKPSRNDSSANAVTRSREDPSPSQRLKARSAQPARMPPVLLAKRLRQNPQVAYVIAQMKKSLHHSGTAGALDLQDEQAIYNEVEQMLLNSPSVLHEIQRMQQG